MPTPKPKPKPEVTEFEKEVVRLPDGRELTYYRFPAEHPPIEPPASPGVSREP